MTTGARRSAGHFDVVNPGSCGQLATVPAGDSHVDAVAAHGHPFGPEQVQLVVALVRCTRAVRVQHSMPRHLGTVARHDSSHRARRPGADVLRDVAVGHHLAGRNLLDGIEHKAGEGCHDR